MNLGRETALRAGACLIAVGLAWSAIAFFSFGLYGLLAPVWGVQGAAFATAGLCAALAGILAWAALRRAPTPIAQIARPAVSPGQNAHLISALQELAQDHPLLSVCAAAILGAVGGADARRH